MIQRLPLDRLPQNRRFNRACSVDKRLKGGSEKAFSPDMRGLLGLCVVASLVGLSLAACPPDWTSHGFKCVRLFREPVSWKEAEEKCRSFTNFLDEPGHFLSLADKKEIELLGLMSEGEDVLDGLWVGLSRHGAPGKNGGGDDGGDSAPGLRKNTMAWSNGLPTNLPYLLVNELLDVTGDGDCARTAIGLRDHTPSASLVSAHCDARLPFVCELSACPNGWTAHAGHCYMYVAEPSSWSEAERRCQRYEVEEFKGHLVSITTNEENEFLTEWQRLMVGSQRLQATWIGLYRAPGGAGMTWTADADPGSSPAPGWCTQTHRSGAAGRWADGGDCAGPAPSVCKVSACPAGLVALRGECLLYLARDPDAAAGDEEELSGGDRRDGEESHRASRRRRAAFNFQSFASKFKRKNAAAIAPSRTTSSTFRSKFANLWKTKASTKSTSSKKATFSSLKFGNSLASGVQKGRPSSPFSSGSLLKPGARVTSSASNVQTVSSQCPSGWTTGLGSCYLYPREAKAWGDAEDHCKGLELGGDFAGYQAHLITVGNMLENMRLFLLQGGSASHVWIGRQDVGEQSRWTVNDGTDFKAFLSKSGDQPSGCVYVHFKMKYNWGHKDCSEKLRFVCEVKKSDPYKKNETSTVAPAARQGTDASSVVKTETLRSPAGLESPQPASAPSSATGQARCFPGWLEFEDFCYHISSEALPWETASETCASYLYGKPEPRRAQLLSVTSAAEDEFLAKSVPASTPFWIGRSGSGSAVASTVPETNAVETDTCPYALSKERRFAACGKSLRYVCKMPKAIVERLVRKKRSLPE